MSLSKYGTHESRHVRRLTHVNLKNQNSAKLARRGSDRTLHSAPVALTAQRSPTLPTLAASAPAMKLSSSAFWSSPLEKVPPFQ